MKFRAQSERFLAGLAVNAAVQRMIDSRLLNVVLVLMLTASILGPVLTEHFAPRLLKDATSYEGCHPQKASNETHLNDGEKSLQA